MLAITLIYICTNQIGEKNDQIDLNVLGELEEWNRNHSNEFFRLRSDLKFNENKRDWGIFLCLLLFSNALWWYDNQWKKTEILPIMATTSRDAFKNRMVFTLPCSLIAWNPLSCLKARRGSTAVLPIVNMRRKNYHFVLFGIPGQSLKRSYVQIQHITLYFTQRLMFECWTFLSWLERADENNVLLIFIYCKCVSVYT